MGLDQALLHKKDDIAAGVSCPSKIPSQFRFSGLPDTCKPNKSVQSGRHGGAKAKHKSCKILELEEKSI